MTQRDRIEVMLQSMMASPVIMEMCARAGAQMEERALEVLRRTTPNAPALAAASLAFAHETVSFARLFVALIDSTAGVPTENPLEALLRKFDGTPQ